MPAAADSEDEKGDGERYYVTKRTESLFVSCKRGLESKRVFKAVVAIDFGTTRSAVLIALKKKGSDDPTIFTPDWNQGVDFAEDYSVKTDCSLLLDKEANFLAFGQKARDLAQRTYSKAYTRTRDDYWLFFEHFKMALHKTKDLDTAEITAANGHSLNASVVFTRALEYLKKTAVNILLPEASAAKRMVDTTLVMGEIEEDYVLPADESEIRWVLTVPAIWSEDAKDFMRKRAFGAKMGTDNEQLIFLYEPEAASISLQLQLRSAAAAMDSRRPLEGMDTTLIETGDVYLVLDCGGGTVDVVAHKWFAPFEVREVIAPMGGNFGSIYVEREFEKLLTDIFGAKLAEFQRKLPSAWLRLKDACVKAKETFGTLEDEMYSVELDNDFVKSFKKKELGNCVRAFRERTAKGVDFMCGRILLIDEKLMAAMFDKVVSKITKLLDHLLWRFEAELRKLRYVFVVGGFAESKYLQKRLEEVLTEGIQLLVPESPGLAVVRGAANVEFIHSTVKARVLRRTYGRHMDLSLSDVRKWASKTDTETRGRVYKSEIDGTRYVRYCFEVIAKKGAPVECGHSVTLTSSSALKTQTGMAVNVYFSEEQTEDHFLPIKYKERVKFAVGGKEYGILFPDWFDAGKGIIQEKYTFAEERELQLEVTLKCGGRTQVTNVDAVTYECVGDTDIIAASASASS